MKWNSTINRKLKLLTLTLIRKILNKMTLTF